MIKERLVITRVPHYDSPKHAHRLLYKCLRDCQLRSFYLQRSTPCMTDDHLCHLSTSIVRAPYRSSPSFWLANIPALVLQSFYVVGWAEGFTPRVSATGGAIIVVFLTWMRIRCFHEYSSRSHLVGTLLYELILYLCGLFCKITFTVQTAWAKSLLLRTVVIIIIIVVVYYPAASTSLLVAPCGFLLQFSIIFSCIVSCIARIFCLFVCFLIARCNPVSWVVVR